MGTPTRTSILLDLKSTLQGITAAGGYKTTVTTVEETVRPVEDVPSAQKPYLAFAVGLETAEHHHCDMVQFTMPVVVVGYVANSNTWATRSAEINNLIDDVIAAIEADTTLGGYCVSSTIKGVETNESDPDSGADGWFYIDIDVAYQRTTGAS
jgi:hypothetical protein